MPDPKPPYKMTVKLTSARPDAIAEALAELRRLMSDYDQSGETAATITIESYKEIPLVSIRDDFELWLYKYKIGIECEIKRGEPGLRPETVLRLKRSTPMDDEGWNSDEPDEEEDDEPLITPPPWEPLQLAAPNDAEEGEIVEEAEALAAEEA